MKNMHELIKKASVWYTGILKKGWNKGKLYKLGIIILIVLAWPLTLLALCWNVYHKFNKQAVSWLATAGVLIVTLPLTIGWVGGLTDHSAKPTATTTTVNDCVGPDGKHIGLSPADCEKFNNDWKNGQQNQQTQQPTQATQTPEEKIEAKVRVSLDSKKFREVRVTKQVNGGYGIFVAINGSDNLSNDLIRKGIWLDMANIYAAVYKEPMDVNEVAVVANMDMVDKYGKTSNQAVMKTSLEKDEAVKVNWTLDHSTLGLQILPGVWTTDINRFK
jgi:hypothetical protein